MATVVGDGVAEAAVLRWTGALSVCGTVYRFQGKRILCMRVLTMSSGCTISVAIEPAESPATVSTRAGEMPAFLASMRRAAWKRDGPQ